uniref:Uncharacterized protein n=1 Tax=Chromera velia CCMP2878 TaxID=1169474 RepID=A0A0G4I650_9ALVE|eukprot:Cvel_11292.t1-p1 / transcript=Cvel_11292.t1 / gene=Cvel_11292 / organism=Chromera_velia_CCMP2878 / gene_product=hypothetical protein / transcript_product=hypothetical protein / location=Cvel_scaffold705:28011-31346(+) / protein_length=426 / sequence_SO=supercontig / SO=protein_coding / is_pseudo=false
MDQPVKDSRRPSVTPDGTAGAPAAEATDGDREAPLGEGGGVVVPSPSFRVLGIPGRPLSGNRVGVPPLVVRRSSSSVAVAEVASVRVKRHIESPEAPNSFRASLQSELQKFESAAVQFHPDRRVVRDRSQRNLIAKLDAAHEELENRQAKVDASKQSVSSKGGIRFREDPASQSVSPEGKRVSPKPRRVHLLERALKRTLQDEADFPDDEERWGEITRPSSPVSLSGKEKEAKDAKRPAEPPGFQAGGRRQSLDERVSRGVGGWLDSEGYRSVSPERVGIAPSSHRENLNTKLRDDDMEAAGQKVKCLDKREHQGVTSQVVAEKIAAISSLEMNIKSFYDGCHPAAIGVPSDWKAHAVEVAAVGAAGQTLRKSHTSAALQNFRLGGASGMGRRSSIKIVEDEETPEEREKKLKVSESLGLSSSALR